MFAKTWNQAVAVRIFIGAGEGFIHAASLYLSFWYGPPELATRGAIYFSMSTLAGAFNGLVSYAIAKNLAHSAPYAPWQWILLIEGVLTIAFGLLVLVLLPPVPERLKWGFTPHETRLAVVRTWQANNTPNATFRWHQLSQTFKSPMFYTYTLLFCSTQIAITSLGSFLPATIKGLGHSGVTAQLLTVPVYACAFATTISIGFISDKIQRRGLCIALCSTLSLIGYTVLIALDSKSPRTAGTRYAGICLAAAGQFPNANLILAWNAFTHRATSSTLIAMIGQAAALAGLQGFDTPPFYVKGMRLCLVLWRLYKRECVNNVRDSYVAGAQKRKSKHLSDSSKTRTHDRETTFRQTG
jgi:MFS family permease